MVLQVGPDLLPKVNQQVVHPTTSHSSKLVVLQSDLLSGPLEHAKLKDLTGQLSTRYIWKIINALRF